LLGLVVFTHTFTRVCPPGPGVLLFFAYKVNRLLVSLLLSSLLSLLLFVVDQYVNTRFEMVDSSQSPEIISLTSGVQ